MNHRILFACALAFGLLPFRFASAGTGEFNLIDGSGLEYSVNANITFSTSSSASGAASEASYTHVVAADTASGGVAVNSLNDMFDGYGALCVSLTNALGPCTTGNADYIIYNKNGVATLELAGRQVVFNPQTIGALTVSRKVFVPENDEFIRWQNIFTNNGTEPITFTASIANNLGSDSNTRIVDTSNGTGTTSPVEDLTTTWVVTFQNFSGTTSSDPRVAHVLQTPGATAPLVAVHFADGDDNPYWTYSVTLTAGETATLVNFTVGTPTRAAAIAKAQELALLPASAFQGMSSAMVAQVQNFYIPCADQHDQCNDVIDDGVGGCLVVPLDNTPCNDDNVCTNVDRCVAGACEGHIIACVDDANPCKVATCDPVVGCQIEDAPEGTPCHDDNPCTDDACSAGACVSTPNDANSCDDDNACTDDTCSAGACSGTPNDANSCDDANACTDDVCNAGDCVGTPNNANSCDDGNPCTDDACSAGYCVGNTNDSNLCDDNNPCTTDVCMTGTCFSVGDTYDACDDHNPCTTADTCNGAGTCAGSNDDGAFCADSNPCTDEACSGGTCVPTVVESRPCDDNNDCTADDLCNASGTCVGTPETGVACQGVDPCIPGICVAGGCIMELAGSFGIACDDSEPCSVDDICGGGACGGVPKNCSSASGPCAVGYCDLDTGNCLSEAINEGLECDDSDPCTVATLCEAGHCMGDLVDCSDLDDVCLAGICNETGTCVAVPANDEGICDDGDPCTVDDVCGSGACVGVALDCSDLDDACHVGQCDESGSCVAAAANDGDACTDGDANTTNDTCQAGACVGVPVTGGDNDVVGGDSDVVGGDLDVVGGDLNVVGGDSAHAPGNNTNTGSDDGCSCRNNRATALVPWLALVVLVRSFGRRRSR